MKWKANRRFKVEWLETASLHTVLGSQNCINHTNVVATQRNCIIFDAIKSVVERRRCGQGYGWSVLLVGGRHGVDRGQPAATTNCSTAAVLPWNGRAGTNRILEPLIHAHATRFTATNPNCRRLIDAAVTAVSMAHVVAFHRVHVRHGLLMSPRWDNSTHPAADASLLR